MHRTHSARRLGGALRRAVDFLCAAAGLTLLMPVALVVAVVVKADLRGPLLFRQPRVGLHGRHFTILKFTTMRAEEFAGQPDYQRTTRASRVVRALSLDELPQLVNILRGDMSLIGPRPLPPWYMEHWSDRYKARAVIRPGLTGWAQVKGRNSLTLPERFELDLWYIEHRSLALDLRIVAATLGQLVRPCGVTGPGGTIPWFPTEPQQEAERTAG